MSANDNAPPDPRAGTQKAKDRACPICGRPRDPRFDPFCSKRCADVDLHRWLKGSYIVPGESVRPEPGEDEE